MKRAFLAALLCACSSAAAWVNPGLASQHATTSEDPFRRPPVTPVVHSARLCPRHVTQEGRRILRARGTPAAQWSCQHVEGASARAMVSGRMLQTTASSTFSLAISWSREAGW